MISCGKPGPCRQIQAADFKLSEAVQVVKPSMNSRETSTSEKLAFVPAGPGWAGIIMQSWRSDLGFDP